MHYIAGEQGREFRCDGLIQSEVCVRGSCSLTYEGSGLVIFDRGTLSAQNADARQWKHCGMNTSESIPRLAVR